MTIVSRAIRVAVIDSGVHATHPHVNGIAGGVGIDLDGGAHVDFVDRLGHGTAVTAVIREKAPLAEIFAIKVFDRQLATTGRALVAACEWALTHDAALLNLSLGTLNDDHEVQLSALVRRARDAGAVIVAAGPELDRRWLPGALPDVWRVRVDWTLPRDRCRAIVTADGHVSIAASGFPRPIPGVPPEQNLKGLSFAVANATGLLAGLLETLPPGGSPRDILFEAINAGWSG